MKPDFDADAHLQLALQQQEFTLDPDWHEAIKSNLKTAAQMAQLLQDFDLDDHVEPASVFQP